MLNWCKIFEKLDLNITLFYYIQNLDIHQIFDICNCT
ncbi:unnamed protein product [Brassica oleracea]